MKIITILGARPQFVKAAVVSRIISEYNDKNDNVIKEVIIHTGQHYDKNMSSVFFEEMRLPKPDYNLGICDSSHGSMTGRMLEEIETIILKEEPACVIVYGDTNSTLAGSLAASKLHIPVAHVEAGLRSFNMHMPEEINRILTDRVSKFLFCPTETAVNNLSDEGIVNNSRLKPQSPIVMNVGDVMFDAVLFYRNISKPSAATKELINRVESDYYVATVHRAENTDVIARLSEIMEAFKEIADKRSVILPVHPRTRKIMDKYDLHLKGVHIIEPVGYFDMLALLDNCKAVFTDSGGLQKEAYFFGKPCITLRDETEWVELVTNGFNTLVGARRVDIIKAEEKISSHKNDFSEPLYGTGNAGEQIVQTLIDDVR